MTKCFQNKYFQVKFLQVNDIKSVCELIKRSFFFMNPHWKRFHQNDNDIEQLWSKYIETSSQIDQYFLPQIEASIKSKIGLGIRLKSNKQIVCVTIMTDIVDYQDILLNKPQSVFDTINELAQQHKIGMQLQNDIISETYKRGVVGYANYIAVKQNFIKYNLATFIHAFAINHLKSLGYQKLYGKSTNKFSRRLTQKLGAVVLSQKQFSQKYSQKRGFYIFCHNLKTFTFPEQLVTQWKNLQLKDIQVRGENKHKNKSKL